MPRARTRNKPVGERRSAIVETTRPGGAGADEPQARTADVWLKVLNGAAAGLNVPLESGVYLLGRAEDSTIQLPDGGVSKHHATLSADGGWVLTDLDSTNGTFVNGVAIDGPCELAVGDHLSLGGTELELVAAAAPPDVRTARREPPEPAGRRDRARRRRRGARTVLVSHAPADREIAEAIVAHLREAGHLVWIDRSRAGDGWGGRLLDAVWSCDAIVFVVSPDAARSAAVTREVHLAAVERRPVLPVIAADTDLPDDLAYYLETAPPIDLGAGLTDGLHLLERAVERV
ncbi:MAG: TIR domain-containing protein, partial [Acidimicrobiia bacterium]|nr:TIR domain-containing protein [Acidimicrobiia bacterium]